MSYSPTIESNATCNTNITDHKAMLDPVENVLLKPASNDNSAHDPQYDEEVNQFLDEVKEELLWDNADATLENYEFSEDTHSVGPIPDCYQEMLQSKMKEAKSRLEKLSNLVCATSPSTAAHIKRIEEDHSTTFCKMDYPRHPPLDKPWTNSWKFQCTIKCREINNDPNHSHTGSCQSLEVEDHATGVSITNPNIPQNDFPEHIVYAAKLFRDFAKIAIKEKFSDSKEDTGIIYDKCMWTSIMLIVKSNHLNELMIGVHGKYISKLECHIEKYFERVTRKTCREMSVLCVDTMRRVSTKKKGKNVKNKTANINVEDKVGSLSIKYDSITHRFDFNSVETVQLAEIIRDYMGLTRETTLLDIACNFGVLSLMMARNCQKVIGLNTMYNLDGKISEAENLKKANKIRNVSFVACNPDDVLTTCSPFVENSITVAILKLSSVYGRCRHVMQALRDMPSIWRVIVYGPFTDQFHENIAVLTSDDDSMGERYLPMQGCILDKSTSIVDAFDIVVLFERKSLIEPKIELLASGPTLNAKLDLKIPDRGSFDTRGVKPKSPLNRQPEIVKSNKKSKKKKKPAKKKPQQPTDDQFLIPRPPRPVNQEFPFDYPPPPSHRFSYPPFFPNPIRPMRNEFRNNYPPPFLEIFPNPQLLSCPPTTQAFWFNCPPPPPGRMYNLTFLSYPPLPVKENFQFICPPLPLERYSVPPPPPPPPKKTSLNKDKRDGISNSRPDGIPKVSSESKSAGRSHSAGSSEESIPLLPAVKSEPADSPQLASPKREPEDMEISPEHPDISSMETPIHNSRALDDNTHTRAPTNITVNEFEFPLQANLSYLSTPKHESENNLLDASLIKKEKDTFDSPFTAVRIADDEIPKVTIKSEIIDPTYSASLSEVNCENVPLPVSVKSEPVESHEISPVRMKCEPQDMKNSTKLLDIENMETPIHNPRAFSDGTPASPIAVSVKVAVDVDSEFPVQTDQTFLGIKLCSEQTNADREPGEISDSDDEIEIISEKKSKQQKESQILQCDLPRSSSSASRSRYSKRSPLPRRFGRSPSPRKHRRSPSPYDSIRRYRRLPSSKRYRRSPSPIERRRRRSPSSPPSYRPFNKREIYGRTRSPDKSRRERRNRRSRSRSPA